MLFGKNNKDAAVIILNTGGRETSNTFTVSLIAAAPDLVIIERDNNYYEHAIEFCWLTLKTKRHRQPPMLRF